MPGTYLETSIGRLRATLKRHFSIGVAALVSLVACQSTTGPSVSASPDQRRSASLKPNLATFPDSATVNRGSVRIDTAELVATGGSVTVQFTVPADLGTDTLWIRIWSAGVQYRSLGYVLVDGQASLAVPNSTNRVAMALLIRLDSLMRVDPTVKDRPRALIGILGAALASGDVAFKDWATGLPSGLSVGIADSAALAAVVASGKRLVDVSSRWSSTLDRAAAVRLLDAWLAKGLVTKAQYDAILAVDVVDRDPPVIEFLDPSKDTTVSQETASITITVRATDASTVDTVWIGSVPVVSSPWRASVGLQAGDNTIFVVARDLAGNRDSAKVVVSRLRSLRDSLPPRGSRTPNTPSKDTAVAWGTKSIPVGWVVTEETGLQSVLVNQKSVSSPDSVYSETISLEVGANKVTFAAIDRAGNAFRDSFWITRARDTTGPSLVFLSPAVGDTIVSNSSARALVRLSVSDANGIDSVAIDGRKFYGPPYQDSVLLSVGRNGVLVSAWDKAGNVTRDSTIIRREPSKGDTVRPRFVRIEPTQDTTVAWNTRRIVVKWLVTDDSALATVKIADSVLKGTNGIFTRTVDLVDGPNIVKLMAIDAKGNFVGDTLEILKTKDPEAPRILRRGSTRDTLLPSSVSTLELEWMVTDNDSLLSVVLADVASKGVEGVHSAKITLTGDSNLVKIVATDISGNVTVDSIRIRRVFPPTITPPGGLLYDKQTVTAQFASRTTSGVLQYSTDKTSWSEGTSVIVAKSQILYVRTSLGAVASGIDSAIFLYTPVFSPEGGGFAGLQAVSIRSPGAIVEDSLSTRAKWSVHSAPLDLNSNVRVFARSRLGTKVSEVVRADFAFAPKLTPSSASDTGTASRTIAISATGADTVQYSFDSTGGWTRLEGASVNMTKSGTLFVRAKIGTATSPISVAKVKLFPSPAKFFPVAGAYADTQAVVLTSTTSGATIQTSWDGVAWKAYKDSVLVPASGTLWTRTIATGKDTVVSRADYVLGQEDWSGTRNPFSKFRDPRDGQTYKYVTIDTLTWMASNLNFTVDSSWCHGNKIDSCAKYGRLYHWTAAMAISPAFNDTLWSGDLPRRGVCPEGWHVPSVQEGLYGFARNGVRLEGRSISGWTTNSGYNSNGFHALPGSFRTGAGVFYATGNTSLFWTASEREEEWAYIFDTFKDPDTEYWETKNSAYPIRCVKNR